MRKNIYTIILLAATLLAASCQKEVPTEIKLSKETIDCPVIASEQMVTLTTNYDWTAMASTSWIHLATTSGSSGNSSLSFSVDAADVNARTGMVIVSCREKRDTLTVTQGQQDKIVLENSYVLLANGGGNFDVKVNCNIDFKVEIPVNWLSVAETKTYGTKTVKMFCAVNDTYDDREAKVIFKSTDGKIRDTLTVHQSQLDKIMLKEHSASFSSDGGTYVATVCANIEFKADIKVDWIKTDESKGLVEHSVTIRCSANESYDDRETDVIFTSNDGALKDTLHISQERFRKMELSEKSVNVKAESSTFTVKVNANVGYDVIIPEEAKWISRVDTKGLTENEVSFSCEANEEYDARKAAVVFKSNEGELVDTLYVNQAEKGGLFADPETMTLSYEGGSQDIKLLYNVEYEVSSDSEWLTFKEVPATKGLETKIYTITVAEYSDEEKEREGHITFKSGDLCATLTVVQKPKGAPTISFTHNRKTTGLPYFSGSSLSGTVDWGDGDSGSYSRYASHTYSKTSTYTVTTSVKNAETVEFRGISELSTIDFSLF